MKTLKPYIIKGNTFKDDRGELKYNNNFDLKKVVRFYEVHPNTKNKIRAFHGHFKEEKYVYVTNGSILIYAIKIDDKLIPSKKTKKYSFILNGDDANVLYIPSGYANGFKILEKNTNVIFYSNLTTKQSEKDDYRFDQNYWGEKIWQKQK
ncbi:MAG: sugar epimerase [Bacteroidia bacterium]|nr:MAG: sugar epimerase [Bacteroidia bacterium]